MNVRSLLWRMLYAALVVVVLSIGLPLLIAAVGLSIPGGPAIGVLKFAFATLVVLYVLFGKEPPAPF